MPMIKLNIFTKMISVLLLLLIPALVFFSYSNSTSVRVVEQLVRDSTSKQLSFFTRQMDNAVNQLSDFAVNMTQDPNVREFMGYSFMRTDYEELRLYASILEKLELYNISLSWPSEAVVYSMLERKALSNTAVENFNPENLRDVVNAGKWIYRMNPETEHFDYYYYAVVPSIYKRFEDIHAVIEVRFPKENIENMLNQFESVSHGRAFLYLADNGTLLAGKNANYDELDELRQLLLKTGLESSGSFRADVGEESYDLYYEKVGSLGWYAVDFVPVETILRPIRNNQWIFYMTMSLLLAVGVGLALILYRNVQYPIMQLIRNIERVKQGDYVMSHRHTRKDEFQYLFDRFNEMTMQIRQLIEKVYEETLRSRDATLKQLQSQINPHFLYNCLSFIMNMTKLKKHDDVMMMTYHLSQYYRYVTRTETKTVPLSLEIEFTQHYLTIIQMRFVQIEMEYNIPKALEPVEIPKLLIQPIVENAIKHGIEKTGEPGLLRITAEQRGAEIRIIVEDNGAGLTPDELLALDHALDQPLGEYISMGTGLWNVKQRLAMHWGGEARLLISPSELGGLKVEFVWRELDISLLA